MDRTASNDDPFGLERFVAAQAHAYERACADLSAGCKTGHWMWFIFPQLRGLGSSPNAHTYGLGSLAEARAYLAHPVLGPRLRIVTRRMLALRDRPLADILGSPDDLKFRSSMTLFSRAAAATDRIFAEALDAFCDGEPDDRTLALLDSA